MFTAAVAVAFGGTLENALHYVGSNLTFVGAGEGRIEPAFGGWAVNGSLWTLGVELACYIALAVTPIRWLRPVSVGLVATFLALWPFLSGMADGPVAGVRRRGDRSHLEHPDDGPILRRGPGRRHRPVRPAPDPARPGWPSRTRPSA